MDAWVDICQLEDIPSRGARVVARDGALPIAIFRTADDAVFALLDRCPHRGGPLSQGLITGTRVVCPLHSWTVDLGSGVAAAPDEGCTQAFDVDVQGGCVRLKLCDLRNAGPLDAPPCAGLAPTDVQDAETPFPRD